MRAGERSAVRVLRQRVFGVYFVGNLLSNCGTWFQNIAQAILVYRLTHSPFLVGLTNFSQFAAVLVLAPWVGQAADRFDRRWTVFWAQVASVAVTASLAALAASGHASVGAVIGLALLLGVATAFSTPAQKALVPALVDDPRDVGAAVSMDSATFNIARAVGPVIGAVVVAEFGLAWAFGLNSVSFLALALAMVLIGDRPQERAIGPAPRLRESVRLLKGDATLAVLLGMVAAMSMAMDPMVTLGPGFATRIFHHGDNAAGYLVGAFGVGATLAAVVFHGTPRRPYRFILWTAAAMGAGLAVFGLAGALVVGLVGMAVCGFGFLASQSAATTTVMMRIDDRQRGRVMTLWTIAFLGMRPIASLVDGGLASALGNRAGALCELVPLVLACAALVRVRRKARAGPPARQPSTAAARP